LNAARISGTIAEEVKLALKSVRATLFACSSPCDRTDPASMVATARILKGECMMSVDIYNLKEGSSKSCSSCPEN